MNGIGANQFHTFLNQWQTPIPFQTLSVYGSDPEGLQYAIPKEGDDRLPHVPWEVCYVTWVSFSRQVRRLQARNAGSAAIWIKVCVTLSTLVPVKTQSIQIYKYIHTQSLRTHFLNEIPLSIEYSLRWSPFCLLGLKTSWLVAICASLSPISRPPQTTDCHIRQEDFIFLPCGSIELRAN